MIGRVKISPPKQEEGWADEHLEVHPAMELLLARMESHPQDFYSAKATHTNPKWGEHFRLIEMVKTHWNRKEKRLYNEALRKVRMEEYHHKLMAMILK